MIHLFHPAHGLIQFVEKTLGKTSFKNSRGKALEILGLVVNNFHTFLSNKNVLSIYSMSAKIIISSTEATSKEKLFYLLMLCFEKVETYLQSTESATIYHTLLKSLRVALNQKNGDSGKYISGN